MCTLEIAKDESRHKRLLALSNNHTHRTAPPCQSRAYFVVASSFPKDRIEILADLLVQPLSPVHVQIYPVVDVLIVVRKLGLGEIPGVRSNVVGARAKLEMNNFVHGGRSGEC